eukprot:Opistho-2@55556
MRLLSSFVGPLLRGIPSAALRHTAGTSRVIASTICANASRTFTSRVNVTDTARLGLVARPCLTATRATIGSPCVSLISVRMYKPRPVKKKYKLKTNKSAYKRFRRTQSGLFKRWRSGTQHNMSSKTNAQKRRLRKPAYLSRTHTKLLKKLCPYL